MKHERRGGPFGCSACRIRLQGFEKMQGFWWERRLLQGAVALAGLVPVSAGLAGITQSAAMLAGVSPPLPIDLDSHYRYLSGLLLGIGLAFWLSIPAIEIHRSRFRLLGAIILLGGLARLAAVPMQGWPGVGHQFGLVMELIVVPLLVIWQGRYARRSG